MSKTNALETLVIAGFVRGLSVRDVEACLADLAEVVRLYGIRHWIEQSYKQVKDELGWADFQVRSTTAIRRHQILVNCAFSFCWNTWFDQASTNDTTNEPAPQPPVDDCGERGGANAPAPAQPPCWPKALRAVRAWLTPCLLVQRWWNAWSDKPPPRELQQLLDALAQGRV